MAAGCSPQKTTLYTNCGGLNLNCYLYYLEGSSYIPVPPGWYATNDLCAYVSGNPPGYITRYCDCPKFYNMVASGYDCTNSRNFTLTGSAQFITPAILNSYESLDCDGGYVPLTGGNDWYYGLISFDPQIFTPSPAPPQFSYVAIKVVTSTPSYWNGSVSTTTVSVYDTRSFSTNTDACTNGLTREDF